MNTRWGEGHRSWLLPLSNSQPLNLFCWLVWPLRPWEPVTDYISLLFDLTPPDIIYHATLEMFSLSPFVGLCQYFEWNNTKDFQKRDDDVWNDWLHLASKHITSKEIIIYVIAHQFICSFCCLGITGARRLSMVAIFLTDKTFFSLIYQKFRLIIKSC